MNLNINTLNITNSTITNLYVTTLSSSSMTNLNITNLTVPGLFITGSLTANATNLTGTTLQYLGSASTLSLITAASLSLTAATTTDLRTGTIIVGSTSTGTLTLCDSTISKASGSSFVFTSGIKAVDSARELGTAAIPWGNITATNTTTSNLYMSTGIVVPRVFVQAAATGSYYSYGNSNFYRTVLWDTTTFQPTTSVFNSSNFNATNGQVTVPYNGIYTVSFFTDMGGTGVEAYIVLNCQVEGVINNFPPNGTTGRCVAMGSNNAGNTLAWTGYLTTSDYINCGAYVTASPSVTTYRTGLIIALINRTT